MLIEVWSDLVCPWCYIGKRNLEAALELFEHRDDVEVRWRSWELDPNAPLSIDMSYVDLLARKYRTSTEQAHKMVDSMTASAAEVGLEYHFDTMQRTNTFDAHRVVHLGAQVGRSDEVKERLFRAYFTEGESISDHASLMRLGVEAGLDAVDLETTLSSDRFADEVRADERRGLEVDVSAVPFLYIEGIGGIPGAQPPEMLARMFDRAFQKLG